jgi:hypothetical protein
MSGITRGLVNTNPVITRLLIKFNMVYDPMRSTIEVYPLSDITAHFPIPTFIVMDIQHLPLELLCPQ